MRNTGVFGVSAFGQGPQRPGKMVSAIAIAGASGVDFCQSQLEESVTGMTCVAFLGTSQTVTPSEMPATITGLSIPGVKSTKRQLAKEVPPPATAKSLKASFFSFAGTFSITDKA